jgi:hypothetical protein
MPEIERRYTESFLDNISRFRLGESTYGSTGPLTVHRVSRDEHGRQRESDGIAPPTVTGCAVTFCNKSVARTTMRGDVRLGDRDLAFRRANPRGRPPDTHDLPGRRRASIQLRTGLYVVHAHATRVVFLARATRS